jgi:hypothetical protein
MLLLSGFRNDPFEIYKQCNIKDKYYERRFYICTNYRFCCFSSEILKKLVITSLSEQAIQINEIDITKEFKDISPELYDILISFLKFYLYLKNGKIIKNFSSENIIKEYKKYNNKMSLSTILSLFEEDCELSDNEKIQKIVIFIKNLKYELMKNYG